MAIAPCHLINDIWKLGNCAPELSIRDRALFRKVNGRMRPGNQNKQRMRGRGRKAPNPLTRSYESNGPDVKIRGTALHIAEKYQQLARDAQASGDRITSENYLQHAEHYLRIIAAAQPQNSPVAPRHVEDEAPSAPVEAAPSVDSQVAEVVPAQAETALQPVIGVDTPQPFVEEVRTPASENTEVKADSEEEDKPRRRTRGTRGRGVRRTPSTSAKEQKAETAEGGEDEVAAPAKPRRTPRARTPRAARTQRARTTRSASKEADEAPTLEATGEADS